MAVATIELVLTAFVAVMLVSQLLSLRARVPYTLIPVFAREVIGKRADRRMPEQSTAK